MNEGKMRKMPQVLDYQYLCEDSKNRVYLSLVPSERTRIQRLRDISRAVSRAIRFTLGSGSAVMLQILLTAGSTLMTYEILSGILEGIRGYRAIGSEIFFAASVGVVVFRFLNLLFRKRR